MSRWDCGRCQFRPDEDLVDSEGISPREQLLEHAVYAEHPLCPICHRSLTHEDPQFGCETCLTDARAALSGVVTMWLELPQHLGHLRSPQGLTGGRSGDGRPLPGGDVLVMLAGGSVGGQARRLTSKEQAQPERWWVKGAVGPLSLAGLLAADRDRTGREHQADNLPGDAPSIPDELGSWALDWQDTRDDPQPLGRTPSRILLAAARYLEIHARWAATNHSAFPEFHADMHRLHARLERATSRDVPAEHANADCFECQGPLMRVVQTVTVEHNGQTWTGPVITDEVACRDCGQNYDPARYHLALRASWERTAKWVTTAEAARASERQVETLETWAKRGDVAAACRLTDRRKVVWWPDVLERLKKSKARRRTA